ncbi:MULTISPECIES: PilZ domain-containing protein [unclassified Vibrio]|uniref:PilZ domain-containing protein n=1 Tax=Vibrio sp. HB236076 TaxID=3232307 RepID=A0AB39HLF0_9VIBR|nr:PilZ domain-containing protein [Vibrio sp. HB161653]MDP5252623.1 PilZ domain-containing protein [Vibrio sp. HB161653]
MTQSTLQNTSFPDSPTSPSTSTINSTDALAMLDHSSTVELEICPPIGDSCQVQSRFLGCYDHQYILIEEPRLSFSDKHLYLQEGFRIKVRAISPQGEGAVITFQSKIELTIKHPLKLLALALPSDMQVSQLRQETRVAVKLLGRIRSGDYKTECEVRDLSKGGCRLLTAPMSRNFTVGDHLQVDILQSAPNGKTLVTLSGQVCNTQRSIHYAKIGIAFDEFGQVMMKRLTDKLNLSTTRS